MERAHDSIETKTNDGTIEETRRTTSDRVLDTLNKVDHAIDATADHLAESIIEGGRAFFHRLFHPKSKEQSKEKPISLAA